MALQGISTGKPWKSCVNSYKKLTMEFLEWNQKGLDMSRKPSFSFNSIISPDYLTKHIQTTNFSFLRKKIFKN